MKMNKKVVAVVVAVMAVVIVTAGIVFASTSGMSNKTIVLENSSFGFIISNSKVPGLVKQLKDRGYEACKFVDQYENGTSVVDKATGVTFLTYDGEVMLEDGADIYDIDNVSIDFLIGGEMERGDHKLIGMYESDYGEFDYFE